MGDLIKSQTFENFDLSYYSAEARVRMEAILGIVKKYAENFDPEKSGSVIMIGNTGLGKTHISSAMGGVIINNGYDVYYSTAVDMMSDFENERFSNVKSENLMTEKYFTCELLIIDDLGTEVSNQFTTSCLYNVINTRLNLRRPTIISTNLMQDELRRRYWDRITSRLFGEYKVLLFLGTDVRAQKVMRK
jgi:DNA replication protein DnaC